MRKQRLYSLFECQVINGRNHYHRIDKRAYHLRAARSIFQGSLLAPSLYGNSVLTRCLRPVKDKLSSLHNT